MTFIMCPQCGKKIKLTEEICPFCEFDLDLYYDQNYDQNDVEEERKEQSKREPQKREPQKPNNQKKKSGRKHLPKLRRKKSFFKNRGGRGKTRIKKAKKKRSHKWIIVLFLLLIMGVAGFFGYQRYGEQIKNYVKYIKENYRIEKVDDSKGEDNTMESEAEPKPERELETETESETVPDPESGTNQDKEEDIGETPTTEDNNADISNPGDAAF